MRTTKSKATPRAKKHFVAKSPDGNVVYDGPSKRAAPAAAKEVAEKTWVGATTSVRLVYPSGDSEHVGGYRTEEKRVVRLS